MDLNLNLLGPEPESSYCSAGEKETEQHVRVLNQLIREGDQRLSHTLMMVMMMKSNRSVGPAAGRSHATQTSCKKETRLPVSAEASG